MYKRQRNSCTDLVFPTDFMLKELGSHGERQINIMKDVKFS